MIFAVLDVSLAVNLCINCSFFTFTDTDNIDICDNIVLLLALLYVYIITSLRAASFLAKSGVIVVVD